MIVSTRNSIQMKPGHYLRPYPKINSKWNQYSNVRPEAIKLPDEIIGGKLFDIGLVRIFGI